MAFKLFLMSFLLLVCLEMDTSSAVTIKVDPDTFNKEDASEVLVSCTVDKDEADAKEITLLRIARKGERAIVMLYNNNTLVYAAGNKEEFPAKGYIYSDVKESNLQMTITSPDAEDSGAYICHVHYNKTGSGSPKENKATGHLTVAAPELKTLNNTIKKLLDKVEQEKEELKKIEKKEEEDKAKVVDLEGKTVKQTKDIKDLVEKEAVVENKVKELEQKTTEQIKKITDDIDKNPKVKKLKDQVQKLLDKVDSEEKDIKELNQKKDEDNNSLKSLKATVEKQAVAIQDLSRKLSQFEQKMENMKGDTKRKIDGLAQKKNDNSNNDVLDLQATVDEHARKIPDLVEKAKKIKDIQQKVNDISERVRKQNEKKTNKKDNTPSGSGSAVAFQAISGVNNMYPKSDQPLTFEDVTLNEGQGFNADTGVFRAPVAGVYAFHLFLEVPCYGCKIEVTILANNLVLSRFSGGDNYNHDQHSVSAVVKLKSGDVVKAVVNNVDNPQNDKFSLGFMKRSGFNGYLISSASR